MTPEDVMRRLMCAVALTLAVACSSAPGTAGLQDSFAQQLAANKFVSEFQKTGDELTFTGPGPEGGTAKWRVHIDSAAIDPQDDEKQPYKGTVKSTWLADGQSIEITGDQSNLPIELLSNGLSQVCWAFWDPAGERWTWE